jgi:sugar/nucleoside kinase (ribokinase family)
VGVLVVGSVAFDSIETPFGSAADVLGGSAVYFACAASAFTPVKIVAVVGTDFPDRSLEFLEVRGVDTTGVERAAGKTFRWSGSYSEEMGDATTLATFLNVFQDFRPRIPQTHRGEPFLFLANIDPELQMSVLDQVENPQLVICDTMNFWIKGKRAELLELLKRVDVLIINEAEAKALAGETNPVRAARAIHTLGPSHVVIKMGEYGVLLLGEGKIYRLPAYPVEDVRDPTGAGDSFAGGFVGALSESGDLSLEGMHRALLAGTVTASFTVEGFSLNGLRSVDRTAIEERCRALEEIAGWSWAKNGVGTPRR